MNRIVNFIPKIETLQLKRHKKNYEKLQFWSLKVLKPKKIIRIYQNLESYTNLTISTITSAHIKGLLKLQHNHIILDTKFEHGEYINH